MEKNFALIEEKNFDKIRKEITKNKGKIIVFSSNDINLNRKILDKEQINILLLSQAERKDKLKQRDSGFDHVVAKIAKKNNITIGINLDEIINSKGKSKLEILGRIKQNINLCNKNKLKMKFISIKGNERDIYDLKALGLVLGMPTWMTKELQGIYIC